MSTWFSVVAAQLAFAANSVLCRLALGAGALDPASFTLVRLASGAAVLALLDRRPAPPREWRRTGGAAAALALYAVAFSFAYRSIGAGAGALILFGAVQVSMAGAALRAGERFGRLESVGMLCALAGLLVLVAPGVAVPSLGGALLMAVAGVAWGAYSILGRASTAPVHDTALNFRFAATLALAVSLAQAAHLHLSLRGVALAVLSGALASGLGYVAWYRAVPRLTALNAAALQLSVPVLAALGGIALLGESWSRRLGIAAAAILGGIGLALWSRRRAQRARRPG